MDKGGAPEGNHNAKKGKLFYEQLRKVLVQNDAIRLRRIADKLVTSAEKGEPWAVKEVMDRVDGKAIQSTDITTDGQVVNSIHVAFVKPNE